MSEAIDWTAPIRVPGDEVKECLDLIAWRHGVSVEDIKAGNARRARRCARARQEACWRLRAILKADGKPRLSFPRIAQIVGFSNHTSALHATRSHAARDASCQCLAHSSGGILA